MQINKDELIHAKAYIGEHLERLIEWVIGDIKRCCRMNQDGTCENKGALVGAFILWTCAIDYLGGLYTGYTSQGATKARYKAFMEKYMSKYNAEKIEELRWSLVHYYSPHHFVLYHEKNLEDNKDKHLTQTNRGILLHLGWAIRDLDDAVKKYQEDLEGSDTLKIKLWRYYKEQLPIMPTKIESLISPTFFSSLATGSSIQSINASGTVAQSEWFKK